MICIVMISGITIRAGFDFIRPALPLVEPPYVANDQFHLHPNFDAFGNVHYVWDENRAGPYQFWGSTIMNDGTQLSSYMAYSGPGTDDLLSPFILRSMAAFNNMFLIGYNATTQDVAVVQYDLSQLPVSVNPVLIGMNPVSVPPINAFEAASVMDRLLYAYETFPDLWFGAFQIGGGWDPEAGLSAGANDYQQNVDIAVDEENFIYICYDYYNFALDQYQLIVRRSVNAGDFSGGFHPAHVITTHDSGPFFPELAVVGSMMGFNLCVSVLYIQPDPGFTAIECVSELNGDWTTPGFNSMGVSTINDDTTSTVSIVDSAFDALYDPLNRRLHVVWSDNRMQPTSFLYGDTSYDYGLSFGVDKVLGTGVLDIVEAPRITTGLAAGTLSVSFTRSDGTDFYPWALVSIPEFYDTCDVDPALYWDAFGGIAIDWGRYHGYDGASYELSGGDRGVLVRSYGTVEQRGVIDLYFYDSLAGADFIVMLENVNAKLIGGDRGIIRMLGVKNDVNPTNYSYSEDGGVTWQNWGGPRSMGWHNINMLITETGTLFRLEASPGNTLTWFDPSFTSFTTLEIQAGTETDPFHVDDVEVEVTPVGGLAPVPALSLFGFLVLLAAMAVVLRKR